MKRLFLCLVVGWLLFWALPSLSAFSDELPETLSSKAQISLVTMGPGNLPHTIFGHTVIRIVDPIQDIDLMVNYGMYNPNQENFYLRFLDGTAEYSGEVQDSDYTIFMYSYAGISMVQQDLTLTQDEQLHLLTLIAHSLEPENKYYRYDFFFDNCATRVRDLLNTATNGALVPEGAVEQGLTIREWIDTKSLPGYPHYDYLFDTFLGREVDAVLSYKDEMFLPDMLARGVANGVVGAEDGTKHSLVAHTFALNEYGESLVDSGGYVWGKEQPKASLWLNPSFWWWLVVGVTLLATLAVMIFGRGRKLLLGCFGLYITVLGVLGLVFLFAQFFSLHTVTHKNVQFWWMWPTHILFFLGLALKKIRPLLNLYVLLWFLGILASGIYMAVAFPSMGAFLPMQLTGVILGTWYLAPSPVSTKG